ncbi:MAG: hypothetical protein ASARMPREDX12_000465 [Alectoria sarmentosa]|nr:MAG: hypothetical protein ASARMPREDX12_000465 [Alectoria sarmentosa]
MPKLQHLLGLKKGDESRGRKEKDADYLARMVRENAKRHNFSALTFRFSHTLGLDLPTAELARMIAAYPYPYPYSTTLNRYSELELSAASVYMASHVVRRRGAPPPSSSSLINEIARLTKVNADRIHALNTELYLAQQGLKDAQWHDIFGGCSRQVTAVEMRRTLSFPPLKCSGHPT